MRFAKCATCVLAHEALDHQRLNGGVSWISGAMRVIRQVLEDHHNVSVHISHDTVTCGLIHDMITTASPCIFLKSTDEYLQVPQFSSLTNVVNPLLYLHF